MTENYLSQFSLAAGLAVSLFAAPAMATTVTFDNAPDPGQMATVYKEAGVTVSSAGFGQIESSTPGSVHIDDFGTTATSQLRFSMAHVFSADSFSLISAGNMSSLPFGTDNIFVTGYRYGATVASASFLLSEITGTAQTFTFGAAFASLDMLEIRLAIVNYDGGCAPCGHFDLDEVTLTPTTAPVPLPASIGLLGAAGLALAALRRRRRSA